MIAVSAAIMAHPKRKRFVTELQSKLDRSVDVVWDRQNDRWDTGSRALLSHDEGADYHVVIQDDAVVCRDLIAGIERALTHLASITDSPTPLCLYMGRRYKREAWRQGKGVSWFTLPLEWGVGIVLPVSMIHDIVTWGSKNTTIANYDTRIGAWLSERNIRTWYPWPSLVDHRASPSLVEGRGSRGRYATWFIGEQSSALDLKIEGTIVHNLHRSTTARMRGSRQ